MFILAISVISTTTNVSAQNLSDPTIENCRFAVDEAVAKETRMYRTTLFGRSRARLAPVGTVWYDNHYPPWAWYKVGPNKWEYVGNEQMDTDIISDENMEYSMEIDSLYTAGNGGLIFAPDPDDEDAPLRRGIFHTKRTVTSDILPNLMQAFRTYACRLDMVCDLAVQSMSVSETGPISGEFKTINVPGCIETELKSYPACHFTGSKGSNVQAADVLSYCTDVKTTILNREVEIMKMLVEYDAAYRSLLQFAGIFDKFMIEFKDTISGNIRDAAYVIGWMHKIPCYVSSCDANPVPELEDD